MAKFFTGPLSRGCMVVVYNDPTTGQFFPTGDGQGQGFHGMDYLYIYSASPLTLTG